MKKIFKVIIIIISGVLLLFHPDSTQAANFFIDSHYQYIIEDNGVTHGEIDVSIENATSERLASSYLLNLHNFEPTNIVVKDISGNELIFHEIRREGNSMLEIEFQDPQAGLGRKNMFTVSFDTYTLAKKIGDTWDISIPKVENSPEKRNYSASIQVPYSFGKEAFVSPEPSEKSDSDDAILYKYSKNKLLLGNINLTFGEFQTYSFSLKYHLENPQEHIQEVELAIPPDTAYQTVIYEEIIPEPLNIVRDEDGNWIAKYRLDSGERMEVITKGYVNIFPFNRQVFETDNTINLTTYTRKTQYWNTDDPQIQKLAQQLKTPEAIYNFVVSTLTYNYDRMGQGTQRLGAGSSLNDRENALCMEFTDLFIALARAANIPAREINGYAYSNNHKIQPLSLVTDVLHAWPEYWDNQRKIWVPVDPTWESTTGGRDYFNTFDVNHFAFVIHGASDTTPYSPGAYKLSNEPQKDFEVSTTELPLDLTEKLEIESDLNYKRLSLNIPFTAIFRNRGNSAIYDKNVYLYQDGELIKNIKIDFLPPYGKYELTENINFGLFANKAPSNINVVVGEVISSLETHKNDVLIFHVLILLGISSIIIFLSAFKLVPGFRLHIKNLSQYLTNMKKNIEKSRQKFKDRNEPIYHRTNE